VAVCTGDYRVAIHRFDEAMGIARDLGDRKTELGALVNLAETHLQLGDPRSAIELLDPQLTIAQEMGYRGFEGVAVGNLARVYSQLGEHHRAVSFAEAQLQIAREIGDFAGELEALSALAVAHRSLGHKEETHAYAAELFRALGGAVPPRKSGPEESTDAGASAADAQLLVPPGLVETLESEIQITREDGNSALLVTRLGMLGLAYLQSGCPAKAAKCHQEQLALIRAGGDRMAEISCTFLFAMASSALGLQDSATEHFVAARTLAREIGARHVEAKMCWGFALACEAKGNLGQAVEPMKVCVNYEREIGHPDAEKHAAYLAALRARIK
jgi:tetratricopeptide (TPR) repeat protein